MAIHDFFIEIVRRQKVDDFTEKEWCVMGQIYIHKLCWGSIKKRFGDTEVFKKLANVGFKEWDEKFKEIK